jgi:hypothetical protein
MFFNPLISSADISLLFLPSNDSIVDDGVTYPEFGSCFGELVNVGGLSGGGEDESLFTRPSSAESKDVGGLSGGGEDESLFTRPSSAESKELTGKLEVLASEF